jgi:trehalose 6-phosphate phosphatase
VDELLLEVLMHLVSAYHSGEKLVLLFDYDGTLTPLVEFPWQAKLAPRTAELLSHLAAVPRLHLGVLSGRRQEDVEQMVGLAGLYYCGLSGIEMNVKGASFVHPTALQGAPIIDEVVRRLSAIEEVYSGAWVEHKRFGFTVHYRSVAPNLTEEVRRLVLSFLERWADTLHIVDAPLAVEATLAGAGTKGDAVRKIVADVGEPSFVFYAGDAPNDNDAFVAVRNLGGVTLGVGPKALPAATACVTDPEALVGWLDVLLHQLQEAAVLL